MTLSDFWNDLKNKFAPPPVYVPPYRPPVAVRPPAPIPPNAPTAIEQQPQQCIASKRFRLVFKQQPRRRGQNRCLKGKHARRSGFAFINFVTAGHK